MAREESLRSISLKADSSIAVYTGVSGQPGSPVDNAGFQYRFVKVTGTNTAGLCTAAANEVPIGVLQSKPQYLNNGATVGIHGVSKVRGGGVVAAGNAIKIDSVGRGVAATLPADAALVVGIALDACAAADDLFTVLLTTKA